MQVEKDKLEEIADAVSSREVSAEELGRRSGVAGSSILRAIRNQTDMGYKNVMAVHKALLEFREEAATGGTV